MKMYKSKKDNDLYHYLNTKGEKLWCYRYRYYDALGVRREKSKQGFNNEKDALRALLEVKASILNGDVKQVSNSNLTVSEWLDIWYETHKNDWKISSQNQRKSVIKHQIKPLLGKYKLSALDKTTYKRVYINALLKKYKPSSVLLFHTIFKTAISAAVDNEIISRNRFGKISIPNEEINDNFLTAQELNSLLISVKKLENITNYTSILLLAFTGLRIGEAIGLQWNNIDFSAKTLTVERTRDFSGTRSPKTKNSYRTILITDELVKQLKLYRNWCKELKFSFGMHLSDDDSIFICFRSGTSIAHNTIGLALKRVIEKTNIKRITVHGLRHTHATILVAQKIPVKVIADRLGNTPRMILDVYGHSFKDLEKESIQAFDEALNQ